MLIWVLSRVPANLIQALADNYPEGVKHPKCIGIVQGLSFTNRPRTCRVAFYGRRLPKDRRTWVAQIFSLTGQEQSSPKDSDPAVGPSILRGIFTEANRGSFMEKEGSKETCDPTRTSG
jgi:hypothetical protein